MSSIRCALLALLVPAAHLGAAEPAPFPYVDATAWHILPETHSDESGYFSLCEGRDGTVYIGTAKYQHNAYLVAFDPRTERQRIVIDTHGTYIRAQLPALAAAPEFLGMTRPWLAARLDGRWYEQTFSRSGRLLRKLLEDSRG